MARKNILDILLVCTVLTSIIIAFVAVILTGFSDLGGQVALRTLFTVVLGISFAAAIFVFIKKGLTA